MLGRFAAGCAAALFLFLLPVKYEARKVALKTENAVYSSLCSAFAKIKVDGSLKKDNLEKLKREIAAYGVSYELTVEIGTLFVGREETVIITTYTDEITAILADETEIDLSGRIVTLSVRAAGADYVSKLSNMFWNSYIQPEKQTVGGFING